MIVKRILIADDEPHMARVIEIFLKREGYKVDLVRDGQEALEFVLRSAPDVLITDVQMPRMTGRDLCRELEQRLPERDFRIIVMTSMTEREHREWSGEMRNTTFIEKPVSMRSLVGELSAYFAGRSPLADSTNP
jgi:DNA-binding response OmpR family regulator